MKRSKEICEQKLFQQAVRVMFLGGLSVSDICEVTGFLDGDKIENDLRVSLLESSK